MKKVSSNSPTTSYAKLVVALKHANYEFIDEAPTAFNETHCLWGGFIVRPQDVTLCKDTYAKNRGVAIQNCTEAARAGRIADTIKAEPAMRAKILRKFRIGVRYKRSEVKAYMTKMYAEYGIVRIAQYNDLYDYYEMTEQASNGIRYVTPTARKK